MISDRETTSPSVGIILDRLDRMGLKKVEFARQLGVSPEYIYRILNGKVSFPGIRETLEKMAEILDIEPTNFPEYVRFQQGLSPSALTVWQRMRELRLTREDLYRRMEGRISRPYFYGILRGDHPFPTNRAFIQLFATSLDMDPDEFPENAVVREQRWRPEEMAELEARFLNLLVDKLLADRGYADQPLEFDLSVPAIGRIFPRDTEYDPALKEIFKRMGQWGFGVPELAKLSGVSERILRELIFGQIKPSSFPEVMMKLRSALQLDR
jgi:transcriptional regulator with XRE-family HTH domain